MLNGILQYVVHKFVKIYISFILVKISIDLYEGHFISVFFISEYGIIGKKLFL